MITEIKRNIYIMMNMIKKITEGKDSLVKKDIMIVY